MNNTRQPERTKNTLFGGGDKTPRGGAKRKANNRDHTPAIRHEQPGELEKRPRVLKKDRQVKEKRRNVVVLIFDFFFF